MMNFDPRDIKFFESILAGAIGSSISVDSVSPLSGGCINNAYKIESSAGPFFIKLNTPSDMFEKEATGLKLLSEADAVPVPAVEGYGTKDNYSFLLLEYIEPGRRNTGYFSELGAKLARQHKKSSRQYGLEDDNYIGSLPQKNDFRETWNDFFIDNRISPQLNMAVNSGRLGKKDQEAFDELFGKLDELIPAEQPALLHGDLWSGNVMTGSRGEPVIIDPAVYYGHREVDLAMTSLFGGYDQDFYEGYMQEYPLEPGYRERFDIHNLYPLLVHVNLFGGGYAGSVRSILNRYC